MSFYAICTVLIVRNYHQLSYLQSHCPSANFDSLLLCDCVLKADSVCPGSHNLTLVVTWKVSNQ